MSSKSTSDSRNEQIKNLALVPQKKNKPIIYAHTYIYTHIYTCICIHTYIHTNTHKNRNIHLCIYIYLSRYKIIFTCLCTLIKMEKYTYKNFFPITRRGYREGVAGIGTDTRGRIHLVYLYILFILY